MQPDFPAAHSMDTAWFAVDAAGHIAYFDTGESGPLPGVAQDHAANLYLEDFQLPEAAGSSTNRQEYRSDQVLAYQAGLFYYSHDSYSEISDPYERIQVPNRPRHMDQLPPEMRERLRAVTFSNLDFHTAGRLQPLEYYPCQIYLSSYDAYRCADGVTIRPVPGSEKRFFDFVRTFAAEQPEYARKLIFDCRFWGESVAMLDLDGVTVRPIPGSEEKFYGFVAKFFATWPKVARKLVFEGPTK